MFRKLCKYEFKSIVRTLMPIYLAVIAVAALNAFMSFGPLSQNVLAGFGAWSSLYSIVQAASMFAYFGVMVALSVLTLIIIIQRFYKGLLSDEGYLMFTLPVKPWQLIAAKGTAAFVMALASGLAAILSIMILICGGMGPGAFFSTFFSPSNWTSFFSLLSQHVPLWPLYAIVTLVMLIVSGLAKLYHIYLCIALGHLAKKSKNRIPMAVIAYLVTSTALNMLFGFGMMVGGKIPYFQQLASRINALPPAQWGNAVLTLVLFGLLVLGALQLALFFFGTERILSKRLNLE